MIGAWHCLHCVVFVLYMPMCYGDRAVLKLMCDWGVALFTLRSVCALHAMCYGDRAVLNVE